MTASATDFLSKITMNASFLKLPFNAQTTIRAHASRFGAPVTTSTPTAALTIKPASTCTPGEFRAMAGYAQHLFKQAGGKVVAEQMTRTQFTKLNPKQQSSFCKDGGQLTE